MGGGEREPSVEFTTTAGILSDIDVLVVNATEAVVVSGSIDDTNIHSVVTSVFDSKIQKIYIF